jgi:DNA-binding SARP family transcriptional activator/tetratricopeptide (TPR) repeat protein
MRFALLGSLVVADSSGRQVALGGPRQRILLGALLLRAGNPVPVGELAEMVWDGSPPSGAVATLRSYVGRLRRVLEGDATRIVTLDPGYLIRVERQELDVLEFGALCRDARLALRAGKWTDASAAAARALGLWRAAPLLDVPSEMLRGEFVPRLERLRLQVLEDRFEAGLRLGDHQELVPQLLEMTAQHPLQERFHAQLMLALAGTGRRAQALHAYQEARRALVGQLAIEPGPELRDIQRRILAGDVLDVTPGKADRASAVPPGNAASATVAGPPGRVGDSPAPPDVASAPPDVAPAPPGSAPDPARPEPGGPMSPRPAQLPSDIADFTGRATQASHLHDALTRPQTASDPGTVRVLVVVGAAGLGKSTLAVHAAHRAREYFPDGQLHVNLSGASDHPAVPGEVLARFLRDLGVDGDKIPADEDERAALYRTRLAGRRMLIMLDDAGDAAQVRPLLPGSASCAVLVTTRNRTPNMLGTGLVDLGTLAGPEALELFARIVGDARPAAEPDATAEILAACAGLPLAIRICAARLATRPQWRIATMAARLRDERRRLDELHAGDLEVRASFQVSYDSLGAGRRQGDPARAFRLLGLWQGQWVSLPAAAALTGEPEQDVAGALETLVDANLLESPEPDCYHLHDLLRLFATERAQAEETPEARAGAVRRLLQWYLTTAISAADAISPRRYRIPDDDAPPAGPRPGPVPDAMAWYESEHANLIAAVRQAAAAGAHDVAWRLPTALYPFFNRRHAWVDCVGVHRIALNSARLSGTRAGEAWALHHLGYGLAKLNDTEAFDCLQKALALRQEAGDRGGEARIAIGLTEAHLRIHGAQAAYDDSLRCLELLRAAADPGLLGIGLNNHGDICLTLGKTQEATQFLQQALDILTANGGGNGHGQVMENLGYIHLKSARLPEAIASLSEAHRLYLLQGHLMGQAKALRHLGEAQRDAGQADQSRQSLRAALALLQDLEATSDAEDVQLMLATLAQPDDGMPG